MFNLIYHLFWGMYYGFLKNRELARFRRFLKSQGDDQEYSNAALIFMMAQQAGAVETKIWRSLPWLTTYYYVEGNQLYICKKDHVTPEQWDFWDKKEVFIIDGLDLMEEV